MLKLTKLDDVIFYLNSMLIETIESTPNTVITLTGGKKIIVKEDAGTIVREIQTIRRNFLRMLDV